MSAIEEQITRYFAGELTVEEARALRDRVRDDDAARTIYDRHAKLLSAASRREIPSAEGERVWQAIALELDAKAQVTRARTAPSVWRWVPALVGVLLVAGMVLVVVKPGPEVGIKGGAGAAPIADVDFDIFAIRKKDDGSFSLPRQIAAGGTLSMDDNIQFRCRSGEAGSTRLYLGAFVAAAKGGDPSVLFYYPRAESPVPLTIVPRAKLEPVGRSIRLAARHRPGKLVLFALFAEQSPSTEIVRSALQRAFKEEGRAFEALPGKVALLRKTYTLEAGKTSP